MYWSVLFGSDIRFPNWTNRASPYVEPDSRFTRAGEDRNRTPAKVKEDRNRTPAKGLPGSILSCFETVSESSGDYVEMV